jgi:copper chaperone CopZ
MTDWKHIAPITHAETHGPGRRFVIGLALFLFVLPLAAIGVRQWALPRLQAQQAAAKPAATGPLHTISLDIHGMECAMCAVHVEEAIGKVPGVKSVKADFETGKTDVICQGPDTAALATAIAQAVATTKYTIAAPDSTADGSSKPENAEPTPNTP